MSSALNSKLRKMGEDRARFPNSEGCFNLGQLLTGISATGGGMFQPAQMEGVFGAVE